MIENILDLLEALKEKGINEIEPFLKVKHGPMIGNMYEGLTKKILETAIFKELDLKVVTGKIFNKNGDMSNQIDCMIVEGEGEKLPYSDEYLWDIRNVIAIIEVKKNLYSDELESAYLNLKSAADLKLPEENMKISLLRDSYKSIVHEELPLHNDVEKLPFHKQMIYHSLVMDSYIPARIIFGYTGYKGEHNLREAFVKYLKENLNQKGFGVVSFPNLVICDEYSLIKTNGMPYATPIEADDFWVFYCSYNKNPLLLMIEILWTRISYKYKVTDIFGDDLKIQGLRPLLKGKAIHKKKRIGWEYNVIEISKDQLEQFVESYEWSPVFLEETQFTVINGLCMGMSANINDSNFTKIISANQTNVEQFIKDLVNTNLVYIDSNGDISLLTDECICMILPDGRLVAGENKDNRLMNWVKKYHF
ncbi:hypothetical protein IBT50_02140 [Bacillus sp. S70]|uniref:DUF6602 domain-containing protein n=1 Tax=unclassified Bacillus (in: firmicutes) TaxID=185979 RepID=UPI00190CB7DA|nr:MULTISPECIES: DUF6602 domain-containing protein [unclassified Bacillus (in: firmicutes)]MBJ9978806.1 hypothetical protein [Bacillus sp. S29]MBK0100130.1 hypothetical protein [Bacillus sp. S70]MBK0106858.1 hypothetical protein [Bacillus sp. S73]MBK0135772.1 hypothetical protein [Bacillus sp. S72]MBK0151612.1 hypothetical protein [Bacillus sp. S74]